jgi:hypothetical protein
VALAAIFAIGNVGSMIVAANAVSPRPLQFEALYIVGVQWALAWWVVADCRALGRPMSIDHGWFVFLAWPIAVPYHLIATRGARGLLIIAGFVGLFVATYVVAIGLFVLVAR